MRTVEYVSAEEALTLHAVVLGLTRGILGVRDMGGLLGALERPKASFGGEELYADVFSKAGALIESIARNHPFIDGNKRTAHIIGAAFLRKNGYDLRPEDGEIEKTMVWIVTKKPGVVEIAAWLKKRSKKSQRKH